MRTQCFPFLLWKTRGNFYLIFIVRTCRIPGGEHSQNCGLVAKLRLTLCDPMDCSLPGFSVHGLFQSGTLEWVAISFSRGSSPPRDWTWISCIAGRFFTNWATRTPQSLDPLNVLVLKLVLTEPPATSPSQLHVLLQVSATAAGFPPGHCQSLFLPVCPSSWGAAVCSATSVLWGF